MNPSQSSSTTKVSFPRMQTLMPHQIEVLNDSHRFKVLVWHRRARKTTTAINEITKQALLKKGVYWHLFPTYAEAKDAVWRDPSMLFNIIPKEFISRTNESELIVYFRNGSIYQLKGADDPDALRGGLGFDGSSIRGFQTIDESDMLLIPDAKQNMGWAW